MLEFTKIKNGEVEEGRAYKRIKQNGQPSVKGEYVGKFVKGVPDVNTSVKENNASYTPTPTVAAKPAPIKATAKKQTQKNKPVVPTKKNTQATMKRVKKVTPPPVPTYQGYFQKQEGLGCARHALNNLFGREVFKKGTVRDKITFPITTPEPYSLLGICNYVNSALAKKGAYETCLSSENHDVNTVNAALDILGYKHETYLPSDILDETASENEELIGFIINLGLIKGKPKHWVSLKYKDRLDNGTILYTYYDSLNPGPMENMDYSTFATQYPMVYMIKVLGPKGNSIDPQERFKDMANVTTTATTQTCTTFYDPCTKAPLPNFATLEARLAELRTQQKPTEPVVGGQTRKRKYKKSLKRKV